MKSSNERIEKIARNINAMDMNYYYSDDHKVYKFWNGLYTKLVKILSNMTNEDKQMLSGLCKEKNAKYFGLI